MENEKRNRYIIVSIIVVLLLIVLGFAVYAIILRNKKDNNLINVTINQLYSSDYKLDNFSDSYFIGYYEDDYINVVIDENGKEVFECINQIPYENIYKMKDGKYIIYNNIDNKFVTYIFDGTEIKKFYEIDDVSYVKPIIYKGIDTEYIVGFTSMVEDDLYLYNLNSSGVLVFNDVSLVADLNVNGIYYTYNENYLVVKNSDNYMGVIDVNGETILDYKYKDIVNTYDESFIVLNKKDKYGILDKNGNKLIDFKYKVIDYYRDYYLIVNKDNKMALYDKEYKKLTSFSMNYDTLINYDLRSEYNSINLYKVDGKVVVVNNYLEAKNGIEYDKHNLYIIDNGEITKKIKQVGFDNEDVIYTYDEDFNISIYDMYFQLLFDVKLDNIKKINKISYTSQNVIKIQYVNSNNEDKKVYYNLKGKEVDFSLGNLVIKNVDYYGYLKKEGTQQKLTLYDIDGNYLDDIIGNNIEINGEYLIVDNSIYRIEIKS